MKNRLLSLLFIAVISIAFSFLGSFIYNTLSESNRKNNNIGSLNILKDSLGLSENQYCNMQKCQNCYKDSISSINCEIHKFQFELIKLLKEKDKDVDSIHFVMNKIDSLQSILLHKVVDNLLNQKSILNDSQKEKFFNILLSQIESETKTCALMHKNQLTK